MNKYPIIEENINNWSTELLEKVVNGDEKDFSVMWCGFVNKCVEKEAWSFVENEVQEEMVTLPHILYHIIDDENNMKTRSDLNESIIRYATIEIAKQIIEKRKTDDKFVLSDKYDDDLILFRMDIKKWRLEKKENSHTTLTGLSIWTRKYHVEDYKIVRDVDDKDVRLSAQYPFVHVVSESEFKKLHEWLKNKGDRPMWNDNRCNWWNISLKTGNNENKN